jgi:hypothetical protein
MPIQKLVPSEPSILWSQVCATEPGSGLRVPVAGATPEWCSEFKLAVDARRHATRQDPWGQIGLIGDVIFVPSVPPGVEALLRETLDQMVTTAQRRVATAPPPETPAEMLELMRTLAG